MTELSRSQIDRLGERLREGNGISAEDRIRLDEYRRSLTAFSHTITERLQHLLDRPITERPGKTTPSIIAKLKRQQIALSRMQDMAGGRIVVADLLAQDGAIRKVLETFPEARLVDRREKPIVGYHAVHFVIRQQAQSYELQIRTEAQQRWAQLSEKFADLVGFEIKYGDGPEELQDRLISSGRIIYLIENIKKNYHSWLQLDEASPEGVDYADDFGRDKILAEIAEADCELELEFSELEAIIQHLQRDS